MTKASKFVALGYEEYDINGVCKLYFNDKRVYMANKNNDTHLVAVCDTKDDLYASYIKVRNKHKMKVIEVRRTNKKPYIIVKYYIDSDNNLFKADWATETEYDWLSLGNMQLCHYDKKNKIKHVVEIRDRETYSYILNRLTYDKEFMTTIINNRYLYRYGFILDMKTGEFSKVTGFKIVDEKCVEVGLDAANCNLECGLFSFRYPKMINCEKVERFACTGITKYTGYYIDEEAGEKKYVTVTKDVGKRVQRYPQRNMRECNEEDTGIFCIYDYQNGCGYRKIENKD